VIELANRPGSAGQGETYDVHPYVIFFKNFAMVHQPLVRARALSAARARRALHVMTMNGMQVLPWVDALKWPQALRIGVTFTQSDERVRIVAPPPPGSGVGAATTFEPLLPTAGPTRVRQQELASNTLHQHVEATQS
jgi:ribosomal protein S5